MSQVVKVFGLALFLAGSITWANSDVKNGTDQGGWTDLSAIPDPVPGPIKSAEEVADKKNAANARTTDSPITPDAKVKPEELMPDSGEGGVVAETSQELTLKPDYVRPLMPVNEIGKNDSNPRWAPNGGILSFERASDGKQEIVIATIQGHVLKNIYHKSKVEDSGDFALDILLPELEEAGNSFNANLTWSSNSKEFVFMSNAGEGNYDIYLDGLESVAAVRLTKERQKDAQPHWSPSGNNVVFVSGRSGGALIYLLDLQTKMLKRVSQGNESFLYPRWSPDGKKIVVMYGSNENHDILVLDNPGEGFTIRAISRWNYDDLSPTWSPDGKKIAFYSNYNEEGNPKKWSIVVVDADLAETEDLKQFVVATNVIPDVASGPAWLPDGNHIVYVKNNEHDYSPIYIADIGSGMSRKLDTGTNINHDVSCSKDGVIAFRTQVDQWDRIYLTRITNLKI